MTFGSTLVLQEDVAFPEDMTSLTFGSTVTMYEGVTVAIIRASSATTATQTKMALAFRRFVTVESGAVLTVDGRIHVDNGYLGLWSCTYAGYMQGECTLKNGVTVEEYDGSTISVVGTLPGGWTATDPT